MTWHELTTLSKAALIVAALGFVVSFTSLDTASSNGVMTRCSFIDYGALIFGAVGAGLGTLGEMSALRMEGTARVSNLLVSGAAVMIGILNVLRGLGVVGGPC